jgi:tRNA-uridine 2-sulfurtransferase
MKNSRRKTVFLGMSGGVDSSVAALLLKRQGYDVVGVFMRSYNVDGCAERDAEDARRAAEHVGIPFYTWDFEKEYKERVVRYMVEGYRAGLTPNPDVACNREIKFGLFLERALSLGADFVATGHYVQLTSRGKAFGLAMAKDANKDQSYFLWTLTQNDLKHCLFPIGSLIKPKVREIARKAGLPTAEKKDSQGICFLGQVTLEDFLKAYIPEKPGEILTVAGEKIGTHKGIQFYTIGQRHGLDLKTKNRELGVTGEHATRPHYVTQKDARTNALIVAEGEEHEALYRKDLALVNVSFIAPLREKNIPVMARVRYRQPVSAAVLHIGTKGTARLEFAKPQKFVAEGQSAVFYDAAGEMLGGGVIAGS